MGIPSELREMWVSYRKGFPIASTAEEEKILTHCRCEGLRAGLKACSIVFVASLPTLLAIHMILWRRANSSTIVEAVSTSAACVATLYITAFKTTLDCARRNGLEDSFRHNR